MRNKIWILLFLLCASIYSKAQKKEGIQVIAHLQIKEGNFEGANLIIEDNNTSQTKTIEGTENVVHSPTNKEQIRKTFNVILPFNQSFTLIFAKQNYITKKVSFDTQVPEDRMKQGFYPIEIVIILFQQKDSTKTVSFDRPISKYQYSKKLDEFDYVTDYNKVDNSSYNNGVKKSQENDYQGAINDFTEALKFNPKDIDALYNRAAMKFKLKDMEGACADWNSIKALGKNDADELLKKHCENK